MQWNTRHRIISLSKCRSRLLFARIMHGLGRSAPPGVPWIRWLPSRALTLTAFIQNLTLATSTHNPRDSTQYAASTRRKQTSLGASCGGSPLGDFTDPREQAAGPHPSCATNGPHNVLTACSPTQNCHLDRREISICTSLIERGVNPEALAVSLSCVLPRFPSPRPGWDSHRLL